MKTLTAPNKAEKIRLRRHERQLRLKSMRRNWELYLFVLPALAVIVLFYFVPIYGVQIAFRDFDAYAGITGSEWVGMKNFMRFFSSHYFWTLIRNTLAISLYQLVVGFFVPIILALLLTQVESKKFKKFVQNVIYAPYFISAVVIVGMLSIFLSPSAGLINALRQTMGKEVVDFIAQPENFRHLYVWSGIWKTAGWGTIIYIAALSGVNPELYEAATVDGCNKFQKMIYVDIPCIIPTMIIVLILNTGTVMNIGFEKVYLMQNTLNLSVSEVISTYVYKIGILNTDYSLASAIGLFNSVINCGLLLFVNGISRRVGETSLW